MRILVFVIFCFASMSVNAQSDLIYLKDAPKKVKKKFKKISEESRKGNTKEAIKKCYDLLKDFPNLIELNLRSGALLYNKADYAAAEGMFKKSVELDADFDHRVYYSLGINQFKQEKFLEAVTYLEEYLERSNEKSRNIAKAKKMISNARFMADAIENPVKFEPHRLNGGINTGGSEYLPSITLDGRTMIYTARLGHQEDLFYAYIEDGVPGEGYPLEVLNTVYDEGASSVAIDGEMIFMASNDKLQSYGSFDIFYSVKKDGKWLPPFNLGERINSPTWDSQPSISPDGQTLYFSSSRQGGFGGRDLYISYRTASGKWSPAENMGEHINTAGNDESPFIHPDDRTLYFRSNGRPGMGDFDIYYTRRGKSTEPWGEVHNIGYPINTQGSEGALTVAPDGETAYFASDRHYKGLDQEPNLDIFQFKLHDHARATPVTFVRGMVTDAATGEELRTKIVIRDLNTGDAIHDLSKRQVIGFLLSLPVGSNYAFTAEKEGYLFYSDFFLLDSVRTISSPYEIDIKLRRVSKQPETTVEETPVVLKNIFFGSGSSVLLEASDFEINTLHALLTNSPDLSIKIIGHTDDVGSEIDNKLLSEARAKSVYKALIATGISSARLSYLGKGEASPIDDNETEDGRANNRRTEFIITHR